VKGPFNRSTIQSVLTGLVLCGLALFWLDTLTRRDFAAGKVTSPTEVATTGLPVVVPTVTMATNALFEVAHTRFAPGLPPTPTAIYIVSPPTPTPAPTRLLAIEPAAPPTRSLETPLVGAPVVAIITQEYGCSAISGGIPGDVLGCGPEKPWLHDGIDLGAPVGRPVYAAVTGQVLFVGADIDGPRCNEGFQGYGLSLMIRTDDDFEVLYAHLDQTMVVKDQLVTPETQIGVVGATGCVTGPHLHLGVRHHGRLIPPTWPGKD
jgi:murein DD-endopeptidase MepM/ murein hydrolase activator NlpD